MRNHFKVLDKSTISNKFENDTRVTSSPGFKVKKILLSRVSGQIVKSGLSWQVQVSRYSHSNRQDMFETKSKFVLEE